ncbi:matrix metalloproteinase-2-like isoform X2 [Athalia rosae]|uniref:matrix metalloproteinase-2-like isoform X2 n=1 Tax=Athalia rosae TaxID=37344 RepID=UPI002033A3FC|nr:matrix metalloproteinase-2-like isoform X2 [Athalia rosae]
MHNAREGRSHRTRQPHLINIYTDADDAHVHSNIRTRVMATSSVTCYPSIRVRAKYIMYVRTHVHVRIYSREDAEMKIFTTRTPYGFYRTPCASASLRTQEPGGLPTGQVRAALSRALDLWARNSKLTFQEINSDSADILVSFKRGYHGDGYPFDGRGQILAHAFFPGRDRGGDAHFDEEEIWLLEDEPSNGEGTSLFAVAAHEFGHSLGLAHSAEKGALMYPWYQGLSPNYELPEDDRNGIQQMYGAPQGKLWGPLDGGRHHERPAYPERPQRPPPTRPWTTTTTTTTTTYRPWRPRPTHPNHYPENPRDHPEYRPRRPDYGYTTDRRRPTQPPRSRPRPTTPAPKVPNTCDTSYDAITMFRSEIYVFKGRYCWRIRADGEVYDGYPAEITRLFPLPVDIDHVDAVYERLDTKMVFFIGRKYYVFNGAKIEYGFPRPLTDLGLPESLDKIDGAMIWGHNSRTYFFSGTMYWRFDEEENHVEWDYPRDMSMFAGVGYNIDSVFQYKDHKTYFFKGKGFWEFDDLRMRVAHEKQRLSAPVWMGCPKIPETDLDEEYGNNPKRAMIVSGTAASGSPLPAVIYNLFLLTALLVKLS